MAFTPLHATVGITMAKIIPNPWISIPVAFFSHIIVDLYPEWTPAVSGIKSKWDFEHYTWKEYTLMIIQCFLAGLIIAYLFKQGNWIIFAGAVSANFMDIWDFLWEKIWKDKFWFVHGGFFPFRKTFSWQGFGMRALQNVTLDALFIILIILLLWKVDYGL